MRLINKTLKNIARDPRELTDVDLLGYAQFFGNLTLKVRNMFIGLLPEVNRRGLYSKKGFESIFHFAKITGGVSVEQVKIVLRLDKQFDRCPSLQRLLLIGRVSINKLIRVASIVTPETDEYWANQVQILSKSALETSVRDFRIAEIDDVTLSRDLEDPTEFFKIEQKTTPLVQAQNPLIFLPGQKVEHQKLGESFTALSLAPDVQAELLSMQKKDIDINAELRDFLVMRKAQLEQDKERLGAEQDAKALKGETSEHIPVEIKKLLKKEYGTRCSQPGCTKPAEQIHHANRFSMARSHNPKFLAPLCKEHHAIAHAIDVKATEMRQNR